MSYENRAGEILYSRWRAGRVMDWDADKAGGGVASRRRDRASSKYFAVAPARFALVPPKHG